MLQLVLQIVLLVAFIYRGKPGMSERDKALQSLIHQKSLSDTATAIYSHKLCFAAFIESPELSDFLLSAYNI